MNKAKRKVKYKGELNLAGFKIPCYNLEDGTPILSGLKMVDDNDKETPGNRLDRYLGQKSLQTFLYEGKKADHYEPIECYDGNQKINGYRATILADICDAFSEARDNIELSPRQAIIAKQCGIISRAFSRVGIIALVAEATGYQYERERDALQSQLDKILGLYVLDKPQKWEKIFPWTFYREIFRLYNLPFTAENIKRPGFIGTLTNKYVYGNLPKGILEKLKKETPRGKGGNFKHHLHRLLTTEVGKEDAKKTIYAIETLFSISENMEEFKKLEEKYRRQKELLYIDLGLAIENEKEIVKEDFDKKFKALLSVPSSKRKSNICLS